MTKEEYGRVLSGFFAYGLAIREVMESPTLLLGDVDRAGEPDMHRARELYRITSLHELLRAKKGLDE
jgi:hypothetical protein